MIRIKIHIKILEMSEYYIASGSFQRVRNKAQKE